jgi:hypothetical protein
MHTLAIVDKLEAAVGKAGADRQPGDGLEGFGTARSGAAPAGLGTLFEDRQ